MPNIVAVSLVLGRTLLWKVVEQYLNTKAVHLILASITDRVMSLSVILQEEPAPGQREPHELGETWRKPRGRKAARLQGPRQEQRPSNVT